MAKNKTPPRTAVQPTLTPAHAIELLKRQLERLNETETLDYRDPKIRAWESTTENTLNETFGKPDGLMHDNTDEFVNCEPSAFLWGGARDSDYQAEHVTRCRTRRALMEAYIEQLADLSPPASSFPGFQHRFHGDIERVSGKLFRDGHYRNAALDAFIFVINAVKEKSGLDYDGDSLMNHAFGGTDTRLPLVAFNDHLTEGERDEQRGFMYLFKGIVGLRNSKAHTNRLFHDRNRAYEYLSLASLLLRLLEMATLSERPQGQ